MRLNHIALTVGDRDRSAAFYADHFELTERLHDDGHRLILRSRAGALLALVEGVVPSVTPHGNHFGFELDDPTEVRSARARLRQAGVPETDWQDDSEFVRVQVADPDGYRVELFAYRRRPLSRPPRSRWTSFVASGRRGLVENGNPSHRLRVEHNRDTLLVHLSDEDGSGWTVLACDRPSRDWAVAQAPRQTDAAQDAYSRLYGG